MMFIDGKNISLRYQDILKKGGKPFNKVVAIKDTFVWIPQGSAYPNTMISGHSAYDILRAYYYTYFTDDDVAGLKSKINNVPVWSGKEQLTLTPVVFKKSKNEHKAKGDDIALTVEALHHAYNHNIDIAHIFTGDGDYLPLIREIKHLGIMVVVSAFSSGLHPDLPIEADYFHQLDSVFFESS